MLNTILVVDDELDMEPLIKQRFRKRIRAGELDFVFAHDGHEAIAKLKNAHPVSMVLTDINMPGMDGLTLLGLLPTIDQNLRAVVVSAYGDLQNIRTAMNRGAFDFLVKPIDFEDLEITINKTLESVQQLKENQLKLQQALGTLRYQAFYDQLTGLPKQSLMIKQIRKHLEQKQGGLFAVLYLELARYKRVKYGFGHAKGDQLLIAMARRLKAWVKPPNTVACVGMGEFAIFLKDVQHAEDAKAKANLLHEEMQVPFDLDGIVVSSDTSIGVVVSNKNFERPEDLLRAADSAMHHAKLQGVGCTSLFDVSMQAGAMERISIETDLKQAIQLQQLHLHYQPIVSLITGKIFGAEVLVRWQHPEKGTILPSKFIPVAEETNLIIPLGEWLLSEACHKLDMWRSQIPSYASFVLSVNLSGVQLQHPSLIDTIDELLRSLSLDGANLKLEVTESVLMSNAAAAALVLEKLKERQIKISIDDFGTGYSSLAYLQSFPIDTLKVDQSFISNIHTKPKNRDIVQTIITLAHSLGMDVIAEGVELPEHVAILRELGCEYGQGYLFSKPIDEQSILEFINNANS